MSTNVQQIHSRRNEKIGKTAREYRTMYNGAVSDLLELGRRYDSLRARYYLLKIVAGAGWGAAIGCLIHSWVN